MSLLFSIHLAVTAALFGAFLFVAVVEYPLLAKLRSRAYKSAHDVHYHRTMALASGALALEAVLALSVAILAWPSAIALFALGLLLAGHALTWAYCVPCHRALNESWSAARTRRLATLHWARTALWGGRLVLALLLVIRT